VISYHSFPVDVLSFAFLLFNAFVTLMVGLLCRRGAGTDVDDSDLNRAAMIAVGVSVVRNKTKGHEGRRRAFVRLVMNVLGLSY
jgi:hypothetical protein